MADDGHRGHRVLVQRGGETVEHRAHVGLDRIAADVEGDVCGDVHLELVVGGLADADAGTRSGLLHLGALLLHVLRPQITAARAQCRADGSTGGGALALVTAGSGGTDQATRHGADRSAHAGVTLGFVHVGAAAQASHCKRDCGKGDDDFFHVFPPLRCGSSDAEEL